MSLIVLITDEDELNYLTSLSFDSKGNLYIADYYTNRVQKFPVKAELNFHRSFFHMSSGWEEILFCIFNMMLCRDYLKYIIFSYLSILFTAM